MPLAYLLSFFFGWFDAMFLLVLDEMFMTNKKDIKPISVNDLSHVNFSKIQGRINNLGLKANDSVIFRFGLSLLVNMPPEEIECELNEFKRIEAKHKKLRSSKLER